MVNCSDPGFVENAIRHGQQNYPESFKYGTSVAYHCKKGFYLLGSSALTCKANGLWDRSLPKCLCKCPFGWISIKELCMILNCDSKKKCSHLLRNNVDFKINKLLIVHLSKEILRENIMQLTIIKNVFPRNCGTIISNAKKSALISPIDKSLRCLEIAREI